MKKLNQYISLSNERISSIDDYITEKLKLKNVSKYNYHPKNGQELYYLIKELIEERGNEGDFNDIDVSKITDMSYLFFDMEKFNGDISKWNVSNVTNMTQMFRGCYSFNRDISNWDVSNVTKTHFMFDYCQIEEKYKPKFK